MKQHLFTHQRTVAPHQGEALSGVLQLNQQAGEAHLEVMGHPAAELIKQYGMTFIFARLRVEIHRLPRAGEVVTVTTWCSPPEGLYYPRHYVIKTLSGEVLTDTFAYAAALDLQNRKLLRPANAGPVEDFLYFDDLGTCAKPPRLRLEKDLPHLMDFKVETEHLDYNGHLNNAHYATAVAQAAQKAGVTPQAVTIQFHSEAFGGDVLQIGGKMAENGLQLRGTHPRGVSFEALVE